MLILSIDSSDIYCRIGIGDFSSPKPKILKQSQNLPYKQAENLIPMIQSFMKDTGTNKNTLSAISVASGPGSFSGIRIAIATARTLGLVLNIPVLGYDNFSLWQDSIKQKHNIKNETLLIILQSKRNDLYAAAYHNQEYKLHPQTAYPNDLEEFIKSQNKIILAGNMNEEFLSLIATAQKDKITALPEKDFDFNKLVIQAKNDIEKNYIPKAEPIYLRMPQTSVAKKIWTQHVTQ